MPRSITTELAGWGRHPVEPARLYRPERNVELQAILRSGEQPSYLSRGLGRSYGDTALNKDGGVIDHTRFNRYIAFDEATGLLECEGGVSFAEILDHFLPRGFFLPVTPGTKFVTVAGAIANDVHGKNHHKDGSLANHLLDFTLMTATGEILPCSREENADLFWATVGGIGLTGIILTARIRLHPVETAYYNVTYKQAANLDEALRLLQETDEAYRYSVAWIDCLATGDKLGRSVLMLGNHATPAEVKGSNPLKVAGPGKLFVPFDFPGFVLNPLSIQAFNTAYYHIHSGSQKIVHYEPFFYPLDAIRHWNRLYGKRGFLQYQIVLPHETSLPGLTAVLERLSRARTSSFLAVLKSFGAQGEGLLSFPKPGFTLALDIPVHSDAVFTLLRELDQIVLKCGGRIYTAKDAVATPETFRAMYPNLQRFQEIKRRVDPENRFSSSMARRLGIVEEA